MGLVLVCAASRAEHHACMRGIARAPDRISEHEVLRTGVGPLRAARALGARLARGPLPDRVVSSGLAGALTPTLPLSSWITAVRLGEWVSGARVTADGIGIVEPFPDLVPCEILSAGMLVKDSIPGDEGEPIAVDMESVALAREAARHGIPFAVVRLVSDTPSHPLPAFLAPIAAALAAPWSVARVGLAARGAAAALAHPRALRRLVADGRTWLRDLEEGWREFASVRT